MEVEVEVEVAVGPSFVGEQRAERKDTHDTPQDLGNCVTAGRRSLKSLAVIGYPLDPCR